MKHSFHISLLLSLSFLATNSLRAQVALSNPGSAVEIDFESSIDNVLNGPFTANESAVGQSNPGPGQLDSDAWAIVQDGSSSIAINEAANFGEILMEGNGFNQFPPLPAIGMHATTVNGERAMGIQPSGSNFTSGAITIRLQNLSGQSLNSLDLAYDLYVYNDRDRSNSVNVYYSTSNTQASYQLLPEMAVVSPADADASPQAVFHQPSVSINNLNLLPNSYLFVRFVFEDISGSGERDEFLISRLSFTPQVSETPTLSTSSLDLELFQIIGESALSQSLFLSGNNLSSEVNITVPGPFQISADNSNFSASLVLPIADGQLPLTELFVRLNAGSTGSYLDDLSIASEGASTVDIFLFGTASKPLFINEFMAVNSATIADENGDFDDWIELYNPNDEALDLAGFYLSDDLNELTKYRIPYAALDATITAGGWKLLWADAEDNQGNLHTNFALSALGEDIVLVGTDGMTIVDSYSYSSAEVDQSEGRNGDGNEEWVYFTQATPNASNEALAPLIIATPVALTNFNQVLGQASASQSLTVSGTNLTEDLNLLVDAPFEISLEAEGNYSNELVLSETNGNIPATTLYVRLNASDLGDHSGNIALISGNNSSSVALNGSTSDQSQENPILFINEFMASNNQTIADEYGEYDDWIEIYNPNSFAVDLAGYYLSDDLNLLTKYQIPESSDEAIIAPFGFLLVWADNSNFQGDLHTNFALSASGEDIVLTAPDGTSIVNAYSYEAQTADISEGRSTDGAPEWIFFDVPTPNASNGGVGVDERLAAAAHPYPNPFTDRLSVLAEQSFEAVELWSASGQLLIRQSITGTGLQSIDTSGLPAGMYLLRLTGGMHVQTQRVVKQ